MNGIPLLLVACSTAWPNPAAIEPPAVDRFGDPLPRGAVTRLGFVRTGSSSPLNTAQGPLAAFSPDGRSFATVCHNRMYLWNVATGRVHRRFQTGDTPVGRVDFTRDGKALLAGLQRFEITSGRAKSLEVPGMMLWGKTQQSPDGRWLIDVRGDVWDLEAGKKVAGPLPTTRTFSTAAFAADGRRVFLASGEEKAGKAEYVLEQWELVEGKRERVFDGFRGVSVACSPDGRTVASILTIPDPKVANKWTYTIVLYDTEAGRERFRLPEGPAHFRPPVFAPDGKQFAAVVRWEKLNVWDSATGKVLCSWPYQRDHLGSPVFAPDGKTVGICCDNGTAILLDVATGRPRFLNEEAPYAVTDLLFSNDGKRLVASYIDRSIRFWDLATQEVRHSFRPAESPAHFPITDLTWSAAPDRLIYRSHGKPHGELRVLDWRKGQDSPLTLGDGVEIQAVSATGRSLIVGSRSPDRRDLGWRPLSRERLESARRAASERPELEGFRVLTAPPAREERRPTLDFQGGERTVPTHVVAVSPDGNSFLESVSTLAGRPDTGMGTYWMPNHLRLVEAPTSRVVCKFPHAYHSMRFLPDGRSLVSWRKAERSNELELLESRTGKSRWRATLRTPIGNVAVSPCGRWLAVAEHEAESFRLLNAESGEAIIEYKHGRSHHGSDPMAFSPDGKVLAKSAADGTILLWRVPAIRPRVPVELTDTQVADAWRELMADDAAAAFRALNRLAGAPKSAIPVLRRELLREEDKGKIERLVANLDSAEFVIRERSTRELSRLGAIARPFVVKALAASPSLEARTRLEKLLAAIGDPFASPVGLRQLRAVEALERIGSADARDVLRQLAVGPPDEPLTHEAQRGLDRLKR